VGQKAQSNFALSRESNPGPLAHKVRIVPRQICAAADLRGGESARRRIWAAANLRGGK